MTVHGPKVTTLIKFLGVHQKNIFFLMYIVFIIHYSYLILQKMLFHPELRKIVSEILGQGKGYFYVMARASAHAGLVQSLLREEAPLM